MRYDVFLDQLSENARADLCWRTAEKLYGGNKNRVKNGPLLHCDYPNFSIGQEQVDSRI